MRRADAEHRSNPHPRRYDTAGRVSSVTGVEPDPQAAPDPASRTRHSYDYQSATTTTVTADGIAGARTVTFDAAARQLADTDPTGRATAQTWNDAADAVETSTDAAGLRTATEFDAQHRPVKMYGPAPAGWFDGANGANPAPPAGQAMPTATTAYDEGLAGLSAAYWPNEKFSGVAKGYELFDGDGTGATRDWGSSEPAVGVGADHWSARLTGEVNLPVAGAANAWELGVTADDGARVFLDDRLVVDGWAGAVGGKTAAVPFALSAGWHRYRVEYRDVTGAASLTARWKPPSGAWVTIPVSAFTPRYDLETSTVDADGDKTATGYTDAANGIGPQHGLAVATIDDPAGLALARRTTYEAPGAGRYFRRVAARLPKGAATETTFGYYGDTESRAFPNIAGCPSGSANQAGRLEVSTDPAPATGPALTHEYVYDAAGRTVFSRRTGDATWECSTFDARGRSTGGRDTAGNQTTIAYSADGRTVTTNFTDSAGTARSTVATTDLAGRATCYVDEWGVVTRRVYDREGRLVGSWRTLPGRSETQIEGFTYDAAGRTATASEYVSNASGAQSTYSYDAGGRLATLARPGGVLSESRAYYAETGRLFTLIHRAGSTDLYANVYGYTPAGRISGDWSSSYLRNYGYDRAGRLTTVADGAATRAYGYDANSNRCDLTATATPSVCDGTSSGSLRYDNADRLTVSPAGSGYGYDDHGNLTGYSPAGGGSVTIGYDASDHATLIDDGVTRVEETLAPSGRVLARKATTVATGQVTENVIYGYDGPGDSPAWTAPAGTDFSAVVTYLDGVWFYGPVPVYELANGHGDIVGTAYQNGAFTPTPGADEYGNGTPPANRRGWLAAHDRFTTHPALRLYRMGVRLYDPTTGRFLEPDPIEGGSANNYDYVQADPLNAYDLDGTAGRPGSVGVAAVTSGQERPGARSGAMSPPLHGLVVFATVQNLECTGAFAGSTGWCSSRWDCW